MKACIWRPFGYGICKNTSSLRTARCDQNNNDNTNHIKNSHNKVTATKQQITYRSL